MEYMLMIYSDPAGFEALSESQKAEGLAAYGAYHDALQKAGVLRSSNRLRPAQAATMSAISQFDGPMIEFGDGLRRHHGR